MVFRIVAIGKIALAVRLIVEAVIGLRVVADVGRVLAVDEPVHTTVVAILVERAGNYSSGLRRESCRLGEHEFIV